MRRSTKKYSGPALDRYLKRFFTDQPGLTPAAAERLAARGSAAFSSIRARITAPPGMAPDRAPPAAASSQPTAASAEPSAVETAGAFDAYAIGLVPTFQREGRDGLIGKLAAVKSVDNLRQMARAQQIVLPEPMRQGVVALDALRATIADAVAKRIADRRAAAGSV